MLWQAQMMVLIKSKFTLSIHFVLNYSNCDLRRLIYDTVNWNTLSIKFTNAS